jgi:DNA-binding transcriptional regulator YiaG
MTDAPKNAVELTMRAQGTGTVKALADRLDTHERTVRRWLSGQSRPNYGFTEHMLRMVRIQEGN